MLSTRAKAIKLGLKLSRLLNTPVSDQNLEEKRQSFQRLEKYFPLDKSVHIEPVSGKGFKAEWITVPQSRENKAMLYIHGGGFVFHTHVHRQLISLIAKTGKVKALSLDYSLAPEHPYPVALHEAIAAYKWLIRAGFAPKDIVIAGDSAGGALVLSTLHQIREEKLPNPSCTIVIAPATDATLKSSSIETNASSDFLIKADTLAYFIQSYFQNTPTDNPIASPLHGQLKGFPPLLVHIDKGEILYDDSARLVEKAKSEGVEVELYESEGLWHVWHLFARYIPEARKAIEHIGQFIQKN